MMLIITDRDDCNHVNINDDNINMKNIDPIKILTDLYMNIYKALFFKNPICSDVEQRNLVLFDDSAFHPPLSTRQWKSLSSCFRQNFQMHFL